MKCGVNVALLIWALLLLGCSEQDPVITGTVYDNWGRPLPGATVVIRNTDYSARTDPDGRFEIPYVPGSFVIDISAGGYSARTAEISVAAPATYPLDDTQLFELPPGRAIYLVGDTKYHELLNLEIVNINGDSGDGVGARLLFPASKEEGDARIEELSKQFELVLSQRSGALQFLDFTEKDADLIDIRNGGQYWMLFVRLPNGQQETFYEYLTPVGEVTQLSPSLRLHEYNISGTITSDKFWPLCFVSTQPGSRVGEKVLDESEIASCIAHSDNWNVFTAIAETRSKARELVVAPSSAKNSIAEYAIVNGRLPPGNFELQQISSPLVESIVWTGNEIHVTGNSTALGIENDKLVLAITPTIVRSGGVSFSCRAIRALLFSPPECN